MPQCGLATYSGNHLIAFTWIYQEDQVCSKFWIFAIALTPYTNLCINYFSNTIE